jgi:hypothetical protein
MPVHGPQELGYYYDLNAQVGGAYWYAIQRGAELDDASTVYAKAYRENNFPLMKEAKREQDDNAEEQYVRLLEFLHQCLIRSLMERHGERENQTYRKTDEQLLELAFRDLRDREFLCEKMVLSLIDDLRDEMGSMLMPDRIPAPHVVVALARSEAKRNLCAMIPDRVDATIGNPPLSLSGL